MRRPCGKSDFGGFFGEVAIPAGKIPKIDFEGIELQRQLDEIDFRVEQIEVSHQEMIEARIGLNNRRNKNFRKKSYFLFRILKSLFLISISKLLSPKRQRRSRVQK